MFLRCLLSLAFILMTITGVYLGLNTAEKGIQELMGLEINPGAFYLELQDGSVIVVWAGEKYLINP